MRLKFLARCQNKSAPVSHMDLGKQVTTMFAPDNYYCPRKSLVPNEYPDILCQLAHNRFMATDCSVPDPNWLTAQAYLFLLLVTTMVKRSEEYPIRSGGY